MDGEKNDLASKEKEEAKQPAGEDGMERGPAPEAASLEDLPKKPERAEAEKDGFDFGRLLFGLLAVSFGLFLLGRSTGYISEDLYIDVFRFWPTLLVAAGLSLLDTRRTFSFVLALLAFAAVAAFVGTVVKDAVLQDGGSGNSNLPIRMDGEQRWELRGPIPGPIEGI